MSGRAGSGDRVDPPPARGLDPLLREAIERGERSGLPPLDPRVLRLLGIVARERGVGRILEIGRGLGVTTVCLARAAPRARVISLDGSGARVDEAAELLRRAGVESRVTLSTGAPLDAIRELEGRFELIHLCVEPAEVIRLADRLLPVLEVGGLLVARGLAPQERVRPVEPGRPERASAAAGYLLMHPQLDALQLELGDGVLLARKTAPLVTELGGPF
jgi:caffeoyl-CoA O-methyltransferase